jgi:DNA-binding response OmpR family regulator
MTNQKLIIYDFTQLYLILDELKDQINFEIINIEKEKLNIPLDNSLVITRKKIPSIDNQIILETIPIKLTKLIEKFNISFLKQKFSEQSEMNIGNYKINLNSREMSFKDLSLKLTERECKVILFLSKSNKPVNVDQLQSEVWGFNSKLETHTVETHIYRLRKKINDKFNDENFIISKKNGYQIV